MRTNRSLQGQLRAVADLLRGEWDPIGRGALDALPADEYDGYVADVAAMVQGGATAIELAEWLRDVERSRMGLRPRSVSELLAVSTAVRGLLLTEPLSRILVDESSNHQRLETFIGTEMHRCGAWPSPRHADGVLEIRLLSDGPDHSVVAGEIWTIDQVLHLFCISIRRGARDALEWSLWFGLPDMARGKTIYVLDAADVEEERWRYRLQGTMPNAEDLGDGADRPG